MMTIKEFASLCGCNTQTLRYYDKIDLLKPVKVDQWSGYRYYTKSQAIDFVKIKNLQAADFSIEEIKKLLTMPDRQVYEAFDRKIAEQAYKLERIKEIQQSYLTEVTMMKKMINSFCDFLMEKGNDPEMLFEFGMNSEEAAKMVETVREWMLSYAAETDEKNDQVTVRVGDKLFEGAQAVENMILLLREEELGDNIVLSSENIQKEAFYPAEDMKVIWESHGWSYIHEFLEQIPALESGKQYTFMFYVHDKHISDTLSYPLFMIGSMLVRRNGKDLDMHCVAEPSDDGQNHFILLCRD